MTQSVTTIHTASRWFILPSSVWHRILTTDILVQGQGNFGSIDGDPPAAMRYTEARMTEVAMTIMEDLERETVDYIPNYDDTRSSRLRGRELLPAMLLKVLRICRLMIYPTPPMSLIIRLPVN